MFLIKDKRISRRIKTAKFKGQQGIALVLSVLILANLFMITLVVADVILRIGRNSQQISQAEIAYFAAESCVEQGIFQIEKRKDASALGTLSDPSAGSLSYTSGSWRRYVEPLQSTPIICFDNSNKPSYPSNPATEPANSCIYADDLSQNVLKWSNPLMVRLQPGKSFELDFDIAVPVGADFYPSRITINWSGNPNPNPEGKVLILSTSEQEKIDTALVTTTGKIPAPPDDKFGDNPHYRIRIINQDLNAVVYKIAPQSAGQGENLTIGIVLTGKGYFNVDKKEKIIGIQRRNWAIF